MSPFYEWELEFLAHTKDHREDSVAKNDRVGSMGWVFPFAPPYVHSIECLYLDIQIQTWAHQFDLLWRG